MSPVRTVTKPFLRSVYQGVWRGGGSVRVVGSYPLLLVLRVFDEHDEAITTAPRSNTNPVRRHKAYGHGVRNTSPEVSHSTDHDPTPIIRN